MGLIADIVESVKSALGSVGLGFEWQGPRIVSDLRAVADAFDRAVRFHFTGDPDFDFGEAIGDIEELVEFTELALTDPKAMATEIIAKWTDVLHRALGAINVEVELEEFVRNAPPIIPIAVQLAEGARGSQERIAIAIAAINFVVLTGSAASVAAEIASIGSVRSIAEAIQSWVWANGLGTFSQMAFTPQIQASIGPYLTQFYNQRAQAQIPPVADIIRQQLREAFVPTRRAELLTTEDRSVYDRLMEQHGFNKFHADSYWAAHWQLPSTGQLNEMLHRGVIDEPEWERFIRFNDLEPTSIPRLREIIFSPYTRVDTRRMARFGLLDDDALLQSYADIGYFAPTLQDASGRFRAQFVPNPDFTVHKAQALVVFTKVFNAVPELRQRFSKGHISQAQVLQGLVATGIPTLRAQAIFETIVRDESPARTAPERELTRALIARAWKLRLISFPQAQFLLVRMGWDEAEAELILRVQSLPDDPLAFVATNLGIRLGFGGPAQPGDDDDGVFF